MTHSVFGGTHCAKCGAAFTTAGACPNFCFETIQERIDTRRPQQAIGVQIGLQGWICTRCGASNAPFVMRCSCPLPTISGTSTIGTER